MAATRQNYDEREYEYDGYDDGYDDEPEDEEAGGDPGLLPLDSGSMSVSLGGGGGDGWDAATAYSRINAREAEITFTALIDFLKNYRPKQHRTTILINGLVRLAMRILNAPACRRQLRFEAEESRARYWMNRLGKDGQAHIEAADALLDRWGSADLLQIEIRHRRLRHGLAAVEPERARWYTAIRKKELAEQAATKLPSAAYEYFRCRLEQYAIQRELAEDRAKGLVIVDFSDVIKRIHSKDAPPAEIVTSMPWPFLEAINVAMQDAGDDNPHWNHYERMAASTALANSRKSRRWGSREGGEEHAQAQ